MMLFLNIFAGLFLLYSAACYVSVLRDKRRAPRDIDTPRVRMRGGAAFLPPDIRMDFRYMNVGQLGPVGMTGPTGIEGPTGYSGLTIRN